MTIYKTFVFTVLSLFALQLFAEQKEVRGIKLEHIKEIKNLFTLKPDEKKKPNEPQSFWGNNPGESASFYGKDDNGKDCEVSVHFDLVTNSLDLAIYSKEPGASVRLVPLDYETPYGNGSSRFANSNYSFNVYWKEVSASISFIVSDHNFYSQSVNYLSVSRNADGLYDVSINGFSSSAIQKSASGFRKTCNQYQ